VHVRAELAPLRLTAHRRHDLAADDQRPPRSDGDVDAAVLSLQYGHVGEAGKRLERDALFILERLAVRVDGRANREIELRDLRREPRHLGGRSRPCVRDSG